MAQAGGAMPATSSSAAARASLSPEQPYPDQPEQDPPPQQPSRRIATSAATFAQKDGPTRKPEDSFRDDIARHIFGEKLGRIVDDYSCAVESKILLHGRMYITEFYVCFYSNFFGFEKKIKIPFSHVLKLAKGNTALLIPNGINIETSRKEYCFRSFWDREECFLQMAQCFRTYHRMAPVAREAIMECRSVDREGNLEAPPTASGATPPAAAAGAVSTTQPRASIASAPPSPSMAPAATPPPPPHQQRAASPLTEALITPSVIPPPLDMPPAESPPHGQAGEGEPATFTEAQDRAAHLGSNDGQQSVASWDEDDMLDFDDLREGTQNVVSEGGVCAAFTRALEAQQLKQRGLEFRLKDVTVQGFFEDFISDKATMGVDKYHCSQGDKEIEITPWQEVNQGVGATRTIRFIANLDGLPVGPPTAPVMQMQRVRVFGQHGMILETSSSMENVPAGDCFTLEDRWVVRPWSEVEGNGEGEGLLIETSFEVRFVKSTFFKKIIESRSRADTLHYHRRWFEMIEKHVKRHARGTARHLDAASPSRQAAGAALRRRGAGAKRGGGGGGGGGEGMEARVGGAAGTPWSVMEAVLDVLKRIKWDRFFLAVVVFTCLFYSLRLLLNALFLGPSSSTTPGPAVSAQQFQELVAELKALRLEVQELRSELRDRLPAGGR